MPTRNSPDLQIVTVLTLFAAAVVLVDMEQSLLRTLATAPLVFLFPGYAAVSVLFARKALTVAARLLFSLALSISLTGVIGLALHMAGVGLTPQNWAIVLSAITLLSCVFGQARRPANVVAERVVVNLNVGRILLFSAALMLVFVAFRVAQDGAQTQPRPGFTQLWMLPVESSPSGIQLGVRNEEGIPLAYRLTIELDGEVVGEWDALPLAPGEMWETTVLIPEGNTGSDTVRALLYRLDAPDDVYRTTTLTLDP